MTEECKTESRQSRIDQFSVLTSEWLILADTNVMTLGLSLYLTYWV